MKITPKIISCDYKDEFVLTFANENGSKMEVSFKQDEIASALIQLNEAILFVKENIKK